MSRARTLLPPVRPPEEALVPVLGPAALALVLLAVVAAVRRRPPLPGGASGPVRSVARGTARWRAAGLGAGVVGAALVLARSHLGDGALLAAPVGALGVLAGVAVGELRAPRPAGPVRSAALEVRRVRDHLPRGLTSAVATALAGLALLLAATTATGSADDLGRPGRWLVLRRGDLGVEARGPWPGAYYSLPLAVVVLAGLAAAGIALVRVVRRPRPDGDRERDDLVRRSSAEAVVAAVGVLAAVPLAGCAAVAAGGLLGFADRPVGWSVLGWVLVAVVPGALVLAARCAVLLVLPARAPRPARPAAAR
jgi:hypothetical protein